MKFDWHQYLNLAASLHREARNKATPEAHYRTAISRAYYAAFCLVRNYVKEFDGKKFFSNDHKELQVYLIDESNEGTRIRIGNRLKQLHQKRKKADYDDQFGEQTLRASEQSLKLSRKIVSELDSLKK